MNPDLLYSLDEAEACAAKIRSRGLLARIFVVREIYRVDSPTAYFVLVETMEQ